MKDFCTNVANWSISRNIKPFIFIHVYEVDCAVPRSRLLARRSVHLSGLVSRRFRLPFHRPSVRDNNDTSAPLPFFLPSLQTAEMIAIGGVADARGRSLGDMECHFQTIGRQPFASLIVQIQFPYRQDLRSLVVAQNGRPQPQKSDTPNCLSVSLPPSLPSPRAGPDRQR